MKKVSIINIVSNLLLGILTVFGGIQLIKLTNVGIGGTSTLQDIVTSKYFVATFQGYLMVILGILAIIAGAKNVTKKNIKAFENAHKIKFSWVTALISLLTVANLTHHIVRLGAKIYTELTLTQVVYLAILTIVGLIALINLFVYVCKLPRKPRVKKEKVKKEKVKKQKVKREKPKKVKQASTKGKTVAENNQAKETKPSFVSFKQGK